MSGLVDARRGLIVVDRDPTADYVAAVTEALAPHAWRHMTAPMLARCVIGAVDQHSLTELVGDIPGARLLSARPLEPADLDDSRVGVLVDMLVKHAWRECTLDTLAVRMLGTLAAWQLDRDRLADELRELLGDG